MRYLITLLVLSFMFGVYAEPTYKKVKENEQDKLEVTETKQVDTKEVYSVLRIEKKITGCEEAVVYAQENLAKAQANLQEAETLKAEAIKAGLEFPE